MAKNILFEPTKIASLDVKNRFVRSPTWEGLGEEVSGAPTEKLMDMMKTLASGGVGLIICSFAFVSPEGRHANWQLGIADDSVIPAYKKMIEGMKAASPDVKAILQIHHGGVTADGRQLTEGTRIAPSAIEFRNDTVKEAKEMSPADIERVIQAFVDASKRCEEAGFDGIELHGAHGFLISQFCCPFFNHRKDEWGGSFENRARFGCEVIKRIKAAVKPEFAVMMKYNCENFLQKEGEKGDLEESIAFAKTFESSGLDAIELSGGTNWTIPHPLGLLGMDPKVGKKQPEGYWKEQSVQYKKELKIPVILVGGMRKVETCLEFLSNGVCDFVSMSRPFLSDVDLVKRWAGGDVKKSRCISCNKCFIPGSKGDGIECIFVTKEKQKAAKLAAKK